MKSTKKRFAWIRGICDRCGEIQLVRKWTSIDITLCPDCINVAKEEIAAWDKEDQTEGQA